MPLFLGYCFTKIELQWHSVRQCPDVILIVKSGGDEPVHVPDPVIDAMRKRARDGALDPPTQPGPQAPQVGDRVQIKSGPLAGRFGIVAEVDRWFVEVLFFMFGAQRQTRPRSSKVWIV